MRKVLVWAVALLFLFSCASNKPQAVIFDTDMGNDVDDALALAMLYRYADEGLVDLLGIMVNKNDPASAEYIDMVATWYGYGAVPIGVAEKPADSSADGRKGNPDGMNFVEAVVSKYDFPRSVSDYGSLPSAVSLYRKLLSAQPDGAVTIVSTGFSTNLAALLDSEGDEFSPLSGRELMAKKVKLVSVMAGNFREREPEKFPEFNVVRDIPSAQKFFAECPSPVAVSPFELGWEIHYPAEAIETNLGYDRPNPVVEAYKLYLPMPYDRPTWDLTSVLYAIEGGEKFSPAAGKFYSVSEKFVEGPSGRVCIDDFGMSSFTEASESLTSSSKSLTSSSESLHTVLRVAPEDRQAIIDRMVELTVQKKDRLQD